LRTTETSAERSLMSKNVGAVTKEKEQYLCRTITCVERVSF